MNSIIDKRWNNWKYLLPISKDSNILVIGKEDSSIAEAVSEFAQRVNVIRTDEDKEDTDKSITIDRDEKKIKYHENLSDCLNTEHFQGMVLDLEWINRNLTLFEKIIEQSSVEFVAILANFRANISYNSNFLCKKRLSRILIGYSQRKYALLPDFWDWRIIIPLNHRQTTGESFQLYNDITLKQRAIKTLFSFPAKMGIMSHLSPNFLLVASKGDNFCVPIISQAIEDAWGFVDFEVAIRRCSVGKGNKAILQVMEPDGKINGFIKITGSTHRKRYLRNESNILQKLQQVGLRKFYVPKVKKLISEQGQWLLLIDAEDKALNAVGLGISTKIVECLVELNIKTRIYRHFSDSKFAKHCLALIQEEKNPSIEDIAKEGFNRATFGLKNVSIPFGIAHRDFVAWNVRKNTKKLFVIDWEWAKMAHIPCMDFFHFVIHGQLSNTSKDIFTIVNESFFQNNQIAGLFRLYCQQINLDPNLGYYFFLLYLIDWVLFERSNSLPAETQAQEYLNLLNRVVQNNDYFERSWRFVYSS